MLPYSLAFTGGEDGALVEALLRAVLHVVQQRGAGHAFTATT